MIRDQLSDALKTSMKEKKQVAVSTLRLIQAAIKDRDIAARSKGVDDGISDEEITKLEIPTGVPLVYKVDKDLKSIP